MIIRSAFRCLTCEQDHVVRIGMGQDARQLHRFPCRGCGEDMVIALDVDYEHVSTAVQGIDNAVATGEAPGALVVNLHANFVIPEEMRFEDRVFPHMEQMRNQIEAAEAFGSLAPVPDAGLGRIVPRPLRRPDFADEWHLLKKAWSLHRRGREKLATKQLAAASSTYYSDDALTNLPDWVWRFCMFMGATSYEVVLRGVMGEIRGALASGQLAPLLGDYYAPNAAERARRYFEVLRDYFSGWSELSQVHFAVAKGMPVARGHVATTSGFHSTRMFYGNAFEAFAASVDILAFVDNVLEGRSWNEFRNIDANAYIRSDKAKRFDAFSGRRTFAALAQERDSQLRNASHHGTLVFDAEAGTLSHRTGKGNTGDLVSLTYADYLSRCSALFFQIVTLLRIELLICQQTGTPYPV